MILRIDHIALSARDLNFAKTFFIGLGYKEKFTDFNLINIESKKRFCKTYTPFHDICLLEATNSYPVEIIKLNSVNDNLTNIIPIIEGDISERLIAEKNSETKYSKLNLNNIDFYYKFLTKEKISFNKIVIKTSKIEESVAFWKLFEFEEIVRDKGHILLSFKELFTNQEFFIQLEEIQETIKNYLDSSYFNCIAFISSSIDKDRKKIKSLGNYVSDVEELKVNNKNLKISFIQGPSGEMVELIGIK